jgi:hypothetical protein
MMQSSCTYNAFALDIAIRIVTPSRYPGHVSLLAYQSSTARAASTRCRVSRSSSTWNKKQSGNPAGRRSVTKALIAAGFDPDSLCAEVIKKTVEGFRTLDPADKDEGQSWRWCADKAWVLVNLPMKPLEASDSDSQLTPEEYEEELDLIARERISKMTPEERFALMAGPVTSDTQQ